MFACYHSNHTQLIGKGYSLVFFNCLVTRHVKYLSICEIQICSTEDHFSSPYATLLKWRDTYSVKVTKLLNLCLNVCHIFILMKYIWPLTVLPSKSMIQ